MVGSLTGITVHFTEEDWKLSSCVLEGNLFPGRQTDENIAEAYRQYYGKI